MTEKELIRQDFPAVYNHPEIIFFDNAATTQKPISVIRQMTQIWENGVTAVGRSSGELARAQADAYEQAHKKIANFFGARADELIIVPSATQGLNLLAENFCHLLKKDEKILLAVSNHHSNLAPWLKRAAAKVVWLPFQSSGKIDLAALNHILQTQKIGLVSFPLVSNVFGVEEDLDAVLKIIQHQSLQQHRHIFCCLDAAATGGVPPVWRQLAIDAMVVSAHKMYGPALAGILLHRDLLSPTLFPPFFVGGGMIKSLTLDKKMTYSDNPRQQWRAGVSDFVNVCGWAAACDYLTLHPPTHLATLTQTLVSGLQNIPSIELLGGPHRTHLVSFIYHGFNTVDVMAYLAANGVLAREGFHCCQPLHQTLGLSGSLRLSLAIYNTPDEVGRVLELLRQVPTVLYASRKS